MAGLSIIDLVFQELKETVSVTLYKQDGDAVVPGDLIAELSGTTRAL